MRRAIWIPLAAAFILLASAFGEGAGTEAVRRNNFGTELVRQGKLAEAVTEFQQAVALDPNYAGAQVNLAYTYDRLGRVEEAMAAYRKAIELDPKNAIIANNLGVLYGKQGRNDEAIALLEQSLRLDPSYANALQNLESAKKNKTIMVEREARIAEAKKQAEARPKDPRAQYNLARVYASFSLNDEALQSLTRAFQLGFDDIPFVKADPVLEGLRTDPRFAALMSGR